MPPSMQRTLIADPRQAAGSAGALDYLAGTFRLRNGDIEEPTLWQAEPDRLQAMAAALETVREGEPDGTAVATLCRELRRLVETGTGCFSCALDPDHPQEVLLTCEGDSRLLTDLPWEMLPVSDAALEPRIHRLIDGSLVGQALVRGVVPGREAPAKRPQGRLRILPCIANPPQPANDNPAAYSAVDLAGFARTIHEALRQFPQIDVVGDAIDHGQMKADALRRQIEQLRPHLLLIVAHGSSDAVHPNLIFADGPLPLRSLATFLRDSPNTIAGFLIACDLARAPRASVPAASSILISEGGLAEVVVMQGKVRQDAAQTFLRGFLTSLLIKRSVPRATADGRLLMQPREQVFLPTVFRRLAPVEGELSLATVIEGYTASLRLLAAQFRVPTDRLVVRKTLAERLEGRLTKNGLLWLEGGWGSGKTTLIKSVLRDIFARADQPAARPAYYVDCRSIGSATSLSIEALLTAIARQVNTLTPSVLPDDATVSFAGLSTERAAYKIDQWQAIVVLDHVQLASGGPLDANWQRFLDAASAMRDSLVVFLQPTPPPSAFDHLCVPLFSVRETAEYARLNDLGAATRLHRYSGGALLLLNAVRDLHAAGSPVDLTSPGLSSPRAIGRAYARTIKAALTSRETDHFARLLWFEEPIDERFLRTYVFPDEPGVITRFRDLGLLVAAGEDNPTLLVASQFSREMIALSPTVRRRAANAVSETLLAAAGKDPGTMIRGLYEQASGPALIAGFQRAALFLGQQGTAEALVAFADDSRFGSTRELFQLVSNAHDANPRTVSVGTALRALDLAAQLGLPAARFERTLAARDDLSSFDRARFKMSRAKLAKDIRQSSARRQVMADVNAVILQARRALRSPRRDADVRRDWRNLYAEALEKKLHTEFFLDGRRARDITPLLAQLRSLIGIGERYGNTVACLIERELKAGPKANWKQIERWIAACDRYFETASNLRYLGYFHYQRGHYFRRRPVPDIDEALKGYTLSEEFERQAGEPRRWALALFRRLEILWGERYEIEADRALELIREAVTDLEPNHADSMTLRVLQRLFRLQATIEREAGRGPVTGALEAACAVGASSNLQATDDLVRFQEDCRRTLATYLERGATGAATDFVRRFASPARRKLKLRLSAANMEASLATLSPTTKA